jgi:hypothetical protein
MVGFQGGWRLNDDNILIILVLLCHRLDTVSMKEKQLYFLDQGLTTPVIKMMTSTWAAWNR